MVVFAPATSQALARTLQSLTFVSSFPLVKLVWWEKESSDMTNIWRAIDATRTQMIEKAKVNTVEKWVTTKQTKNV